LDGEVALITDGSSGNGLVTAKRFANGGGHGFITARRKAQLDAAVKEMGKNLPAVQGDVANLDDLDRRVAQIKKQKSKLDILFANAGIAKDAPLGTITGEFFDGGIAQV